MAENINFLSLQKSELEYEVSLRGQTPADTVLELRKQIIKLSKEYPSETIALSHLPSSEDLKGVVSVLDKSQKNINSLKIKFEKNLFSRTEGFLNHVYHRLNRIDIDDDDTDAILSDCKINFESQMREIRSLSPSCEASISVNDLQKAIMGLSVEHNRTPDFSKLKFNGKTCVRAFIQKVDEFVEARGISHEKLLSFGYDIFTDDALHWFRCIKPKVDSWSQIVDALKTDFSPHDFDYQFLSEIRSRFQGETENITIYLSIMDGMFSRLTKPLPEVERLEIITHNIRPCYANALASVWPILDIDTLKAICQNFEKVQCQFKKFNEPSAPTSSTLAPEFAYKGKSSASAFVVKSDNKSLNDTVKPRSFVSAVASANVYCPRCRSNSHSLKACKQPRIIICFKCGKQGVRTPDCTKCNPKN